MLVNTKEKFLIKKVEEGNMEASFDLYKYYESLHDNSEYTHGLRYLKQFLLRFHPKDSMKLFAEKEGRKFSKESIQKDYLHLIMFVAAMHYDCKEYQTGVLWVRKAMDLFDFFYGKLNHETKEKIKRESDDYACAAFMFESYKEYFDEDLYKEEKGILFDWEKKYLFEQLCANER